MRAAYILFALVISILLARLLGPAPLGRYYEVVAWTLLIGTIVQSGWAPLLVREVAALHEAKRYAEIQGLVRVALRIVAVLSLAGAATFVVVSWFAADQETFELFVLGAPIVLLLSTSSLRQAISRGLGSPLLGQVCENLTRPGIQLLGLVLLWLGVLGVRATPFSALAIFMTAIVASAVVAFFIQRRLMEEIGTDESAKLPPRSEWLHPFFRTAVMGWAQAISLQIGTIVLSIFSSDVQISHFRIAQQLSLLLSFGLTVITSLYAQDFSRMFVQKDIRGIERLANKGALISVGVALLIGGVFLIGGQTLIARVYGRDFASVFAPLMIMIAGQLINALFGPATVVSIGTRNESAAMKAHLLSVGGNVVLCLALVPFLGAIGAAIAAAVSLAAWNIALYVFLRRHLGIRILAGIHFFGPLKREVGPPHLRENSADPPAT